MTGDGFSKLFPVISLSGDIGLWIWQVQNMPSVVPSRAKMLHPKFDIFVP
jgi:hypothetical protein